MTQSPDHPILNYPGFSQSAFSQGKIAKSTHRGRFGIQSFLGVHRYFMKSIVALALLTASSAFAQQPAAQPDPSTHESGKATQPAESAPHKVDKAAAYYH